MTRMLASVANAAEADVVLRHGADVIDLKDPERGALGAVPLETADETLRLVAKRRQTSATLGDPPYDGQALLARAWALIAMGVDTLKLSVDRETLESLRQSLTLLSREAAVVGVLFVDAAPDFALLPDLAALGFKGAMLDTREKSRGRLLDHLDVARLGDFCAECRRLDLMSGLAGSLEGPDAPRLLLVRPDVLGFRKALCNGRERANPIDPQAVTLIRQLIPREAPDADAASNIDWRLLARGIVAGHDADGKIDQVFVRDFVVPARIGAYDFERHAEQRVVFNVETLVRRTSAHADDMRSIFSYDIILDAIRLVVDRAHVDFIETLAEDVARIVLDHPRVQSVRVNVQKLDVIKGSVGVEIQRERAASIADPRSLGLVANAQKPTKD
jgi:(5-formylfuran-3-yl)methyl phosphate synthase